MDIKSKIKRAGKYLLYGTPVVTANIRLSSQGEKLKDRQILITGGNRGLGYAMAKKFISEGAQVIITGRDQASLAAKSSELECKYAVLDVSHSENFEKFFQEIEDKFGRIDILVNNAGISLHEPSFFDVTPESFDAQITTNLRGPFFITQAFIKRIISRKEKATVLFISSETGETADCRPYGYTKAATNSMVQGLAHLFKNKGIRINAIAPGITATDLTGIDKDGNLYAENYGEGRCYLPEEVAEVACFMVSEESGCLSGQIVTCNNANTINARWK
ncbi:MAG: SDR family oxidoreductase [Muribaculaceae bacterium]|nr:SDR family oxidoreductase [Muribaculaceae bacterium]